MEIQFTVEGRPKGKDRPRFKKVGKYVTTYTTEETQKYEKKVAQSYNRLYENIILEGPLIAEVNCYFKPPASTSKKKAKELLNTPYTHKPDVDNIEKSILDSLNEVAYKDDSQIFDLHGRKQYSSEDRVEVHIRELNKIIRPAIHYIEGENHEHNNA